MVWVNMGDGVWLATRTPHRGKIQRVDTGAYELTLDKATPVTYPTLEAAKAAAEFLTNL